MFSMSVAMTLATGVLMVPTTVKDPLSHLKPFKNCISRSGKYSQTKISKHQQLNIFGLIFFIVSPTRVRRVLINVNFLEFGLGRAIILVWALPRPGPGSTYKSNDPDRGRAGLKNPIPSSYLVPTLGYISALYSGFLSQI